MGNSTIIFEALEDVVVCELDGGSALLDLNSSKYFRLNSTGSFVWEILQTGPVTAEQVAEKLTAQYDVALEVCLPDVVKILKSFSSAKLVSKTPA